MKRVLIGGFFALIGSIWTLAVAVAAGNHLTSAWATPPGRFLTTVAEMELTPFFVLAVFFLSLGVVLLLIELVRKER